MKGKHWLLFCVLGLCAVAAIAGCKELNPEYCAAHLGDKSCGDAGIGEACGEAGKCTAPMPVCDEPRMVCVECTEDKHCSDQRPVCSAELTCVQCQAHSDCTDSGLCLDSGTCADPADVAYVGGQNTSDNEFCSFTQPCETLEQAFDLSVPRRYLKLTGRIIVGSAITIDNRSVTIYGDGAEISRSSPNEVLIIKGTENDLKVSLLDVDIVGNNSTSKECVSILEKPTVTMTRVKVRDHAQVGITLAGTAKLIMNESQVYANRSDGVRVSGGTLELKGSWVYNNGGTAGIAASNHEMIAIDSTVIADNTGSSGGLSIAGPFNIQNSIIARNGSGTSTSGAGSLTSLAAVFEFNTVAGNVANGAGTTGISCGNALLLTNSIFSANVNGVSCVIEHSLTATGLGNGNKVGDPVFRDTLGPPLGRTLYRIGATSAAIDSANPDAMLGVDIDGDPRTGRRDMGADEYQPAQ